MESIRYSLVPVMQLGFMDAVQPRALSVFLFFCIMLLLFGRNTCRIYVFGALFIAVYIMSNFGLLLQGNDQLLNLPRFPIVAEYAFLVLGTILAVLGLFLIRDVRSIRRGSGQDAAFVKIPSYYFDVEDSCCAKGKFKKFTAAFSFVNGMLFSMFSSYAFVFFLSLSGKDYYLSLMFYFYRSGMHMKFALQSFFVYCIFYAIPIMAAWLISIFLFKRYKRFKGQTKDVLMTKYVLSVFSLGIGLGIVFLNFI